jgi:hypothetical protein
VLIYRLRWCGVSVLRMSQCHQLTIHEVLADELLSTNSQAQVSLPPVAQQRNLLITLCGVHCMWHSHQVIVMASYSVILGLIALHPGVLHYQILHFLRPARPAGCHGYPALPALQRL